MSEHNIELESVNKIYDLNRYVIFCNHYQKYIV